MELEHLVPLFHIFLHSPCPEGEASAWLDQHNQQSKPSHHLTFTFLSQLLSPVEVISPNPDDPSTIRRCLWIQTLPFVVQTRILSFLAIENHRFCHRSLHSLATQILGTIDGGDEQFWVERAARHLLDEMPVHPSGKKGKKIELEEDFYSMPQWLKDAASISFLAFPWKPLSPQQLCRWIPTPAIANDGVDVEESSLLEMQEEKVLDELGSFQIERGSELNMDTQILEKATALKGDILSMSLPSDVIRVSCDISHLLLEASGEEHHLRILEKIQPWEAEEEKAPLLLSHLIRECGFDYPDWPSHVFAAIILPKLLKLKQPASRAIQASCIDFCKSHPKLVGRSILFPLIYRMEGINVALRDILSRVLKEMHPSYVSAFCHRLLCMKRTRGDFTSFPCYSNIIPDKILWTESMFSLFQQIMDLNISFTPETVDELISVVEIMHEEFGKSVKFGSFLLCLVTKSAHAVKFHKIALMCIAKKTDTFVTKSIISKLENQ